MPGASSTRRRPKAGLASSAVVAKDMEASPGNARQRADHDGENQGAGGDDRPGIEREAGPPDGPVGGGSGHDEPFGRTAIYRIECLFCRWAIVVTKKGKDSIF